MLGASRWRALPGGHTGRCCGRRSSPPASIVFLFTFTSFGVVLLLGGPRHPTLEVEIYRQTTQLLDLRTAAALAILQLVGHDALLLAWWTRGQERRSRRAAPAARERRHATVRSPASARRWSPTWRVMAVLLGVPARPRSCSARSPRRPATASTGTGRSATRAPARAGPCRRRRRSVTSLRYAAVAAVLAVVLGVLAAAAIAYGRGRGAGACSTPGLMLPLGTSAVTIGFGLLITMDRAPLDLRGTWIIMPIAHALVAMPFVVRAVLPVAARHRPPPAGGGRRARRAAAARVWCEVDLPDGRARRRSSAPAFAFAVSIGEFGATAFLVRTGTPTLPVAIEQLLGRPGAVNAGQAYALAAILMVVTAVVHAGRRPLPRRAARATF